MAAGAGIFTEVGLNETFSIRLGVEYSGQGGKRDGIQAMSTNQLIMDLAGSMGNNISEEMAAILGQMGAMMPKNFYADVDNTVKFDYLMIPLSLGVGKDLGNGPFRIYANAGPFVSFLMSGEQKSKRSTKLYTSADKTSTLWEQLTPTIQTAIETNVPQLANTLQNGTEFGTSVITGNLRPVNFGVQGNIGLSYQCNRNRFFVEAGGNYGFVRIQKDKTNGTNRLGAASIMFGYAFNLVK